MKRSTWRSVGLLIGLLVVSLTFYWSADAGSTIIEIVQMGAIVALAATVAWSGR